MGQIGKASGNACAGRPYLGGDVSRSPNFGDYGGQPLKIAGALLDVFTIIVFGGAPCLRAARRKMDEAPVTISINVAA